MSRGGVAVAVGVALIAAGLADRAQSARGEPAQAPSAEGAAPLPASERPKLVTNPDWVRKPDAMDLQRYYPPAAVRARQGGRAVLNCIAQATGLLRDCVVVSEAPRDLGFGAAAIGLSSVFKMRPQMVDGKPQDGSVMIPIIFQCRGCGSLEVGQATTRTTYLRPSWIAAPSFEQWKAAYPEAAKLAGAQGGATLECKIKEDGGLRSCAITNEYPPKMGFGAAARGLAPLFTTTVTDADGKSRKGAGVIVKLNWTQAAMGSATAPGMPELAWAASAERAEAAFPKAAQAAGVMEGKAHVACDLGAGGLLSNCATRSEEPAGMGFGEAAFALASEYRFNLWSDDGLPVMRRIIIPMSFGARLETLELSSLISLTEGLVSQGRGAQAKRVAQEIERRFPNDPAAQRAVGLTGHVPRDSDAIRFSESCRQKARNGVDLKDALADCDKALARQPNWPEALDNRGLAKLKAGDFKAAIADYDRAVVLSPQDAHALYGRGVAKLKAGDSTGGADMAAALKMDASIAGLYAGYGVRP